MEKKVSHGGPKRRGSVEEVSGADGVVRYRVRIRLADHSRERIDVPAKHAINAETRAAFALVKQQIEDETGKLYKAKLARIEAAKRPKLIASSCDDYFDKLSTRREADGVRDVVHERSTWRCWISPQIGKRPITSITRDDVEDIRNMLDAEVRKRLADEDGNDGLSGARAMNVWSVLRTTFKETVRARDRAMRVRQDDPSEGHQPPLAIDPRTKTFVYPVEAAQLLACEAVPLAWREVYACAFYLYLRPGELRALTWADVNFTAGVVHVTKQYDETKNKVTRPKTANAVRDVPIAGALLPLLERLYNERTDALVLPHLEIHDDKVRADTFRSHLRLAGVDRERLFADTATTIQVNFRSTRDSGITWLSLAGVSVIAMQRRAGHRKLDTTAGYVKEPEDLTGNMGIPFAPLPQNLIGPREGLPQPSGQPSGQNRRTKVLLQKTGRAERESNAPNGSNTPDESEVSRTLDSSHVDKNEHRASKSKQRPDASGLTLDELRDARCDAIRSRVWSAVVSLDDEIAKLEREGVIDFERERAKRR